MPMRQIKQTNTRDRVDGSNACASYSPRSSLLHACCMHAACILLDLPRGHVLGSSSAAACCVAAVHTRLIILIVASQLLPDLDGLLLFPFVLYTL
jgi:hypothetical protein